MPKYFGRLSRSRTLPAMFGAAALFVASPLIAIAQAFGQPATQVPRPEQWGCVRQLVAQDGRWIYVEAPSIAILGDSLLLLSETAYELDAAALSRIPPSAKTDTMAPIGAVMRIAGATWSLPQGVVHPIPSPQENWQGEGVMALPDGDGRLDVIWSSGAGFLQSLLYARYGARGWSVVESLAVETVRWRGGGGSIVRRRNGDLTVIASASDGRGWAGLLLSRHTASGWTARRLRLAGIAPAYVTAVESGDDVIVIFVSNTPGGTAAERNSVFATRILDDSILTPPTRIKFSGRGAAWAPFLFRLTDGSLHALWRDQEPGADQAESIAHFASLDNGHTWTALPSLVTGPTADMDAVASGSALEVLLRDQKDGSILTATWDHEWSPVRRTGLATTAHARLTTIADDTHGMTFVGRQSLGLRNDLPATWMAMPSSTCRAPNR